MNEDRYDLVVKKIEEKTINTDKIKDETIHKCILVDGVGITKVTITQSLPFYGLNSGDTVTIKFGKNQKTLQETIPMPKIKVSKKNSKE